MDKQIPNKIQAGCEAGLNYYPGLSLRKMFSCRDCNRGAEFQEIISTFRNGRLLKMCWEERGGKNTKEGSVKPL